MEHKKIEKKTAMKKAVGTYYHPTKDTIRRQTKFANGTEWSRQGRCEMGEIMKKGYYRHDYTKKDGTKVKGKYVRQACTPNKGKPGKTTVEGKTIPKLKKGELSHFGYSTHKNVDERHKALLKAVEKLSYATVIRKLNAVRTLSKADAHLFKIYSRDIENLQKWRSQHPE
jgi:hypothetical protein